MKKSTYKYTVIDILNMLRDYSLKSKRKNIIEHIKDYTEIKTLIEFLKKYPEYLDEFI
jgi:hypothetical protein